MPASGSDSDEIIIKKYANRRLYDTESSSYVTLERLAQMVRDQRRFKVVDAKSGEDITRGVLAQIIMEEEARGTTMLPVNFLRQLISMYGESIQSVVPHYLEASLEALQRNQSQFRDAIGAFASNPFAEMARRNFEMFAAAATGRGQAEPGPQKPADDDTRAELAALRAELAELQRKLDRLGS